MNSFLSSRLSYIKPSPTLTISSKAKALKSAGNDIIDLSLGEPDFDTPNSIKQAAIEAINAGKTKYTPVDGTPALKKAICGKLLRENNLSYTEDQITVGTGAKQVIFNSIFATVNKGDEAIIPAPYWVSYLDIVAFAEGTPVVVECNEANGFKLKADQLEKAITNKTKWLFLNSPSNPSGAAYTNQELEKLGEVLLKHPHVHILSDDIYEHITFDGFKFYTIAEVVPALKDRVLVVNGVSKSYSMTGWRIGYGAGNKDLIKAIGTIQSQSTSNPCSISQEAALNALTGNQSFIEDHRKLFENRKHLILKLIQKIPGITCHNPEGAFYILPSCKSFFGKKTPSGKVITDSGVFSEYLLEDALVAVVPSTAFGLDGFFRISYAIGEQTIEEACNRIETACSKLS